MVTGAAGGIGLAVVDRLVAEGVAVVAVDRDEGLLAEAGRRPGVTTRAVDLGDRHARTRLVAEVDRLDYLVNAAGVVSLVPVADVTVEEWDRVMRVNAEALFFLCQGFAERMGAGSAIVNISSTAAKTGAIAEAAVYAASKAAVLSITRSFATHLAPRGVRVNAVCPGIIDTSMGDSVVRELATRWGEDPERLRAARASGVPMGREGEPRECAAAIWFLLSEDASYITGQNLNVSGGQVNWG
ncbi:SDR family oxidoreductase [Actinomadura sp. NBRC 104412]|nr:SDR family oxidoreductase [Actinomadura sp. NBRC 104412]